MSVAIRPALLLSVALFLALTGCAPKTPAIEPVPGALSRCYQAEREAKAQSECNDACRDNVNAICAKAGEDGDNLMEEKSGTLNRNPGRKSTLGSMLSDPHTWDSIIDIFDAFIH